MQREELDEPLDLDDPVEPIEQIERPLDAPQSKRKLTWCREIMQEEKSHGAPSGTFRESKRPQRFAGYVHRCLRLVMQNPPHFRMLLNSKYGKKLS
jgi:hypothetical protein